MSAVLRPTAVNVATGAVTYEGFGTTDGTVAEGDDPRIVAGGTSQQPWNVVSKTANYTAAVNDLVIANATGGSFQVTLPAPVSGARVAVKKTDSSAGTVTVVGTIDGATNAVLAYQNHALDVVSDGIAWYKLVRPALASVVDYKPQTVSEFTSSASNQVTPSGIIGAYVDMIGSTSGAGSGRRGAAGTVRTGGSGGGGAGCLLDHWLPASFFGSTYSVTIGSAGIGGAAVTTDDTNGNSGTVAGTTTLASTGVLAVFPGGPGAGGSTSAASGGYQGYPNAGAGSSSSATGGAGVIGAPLVTVGGPSGGGITSGNVAGAGAAGRQSVHSTSPGSAGVVDGAAPTSGQSFPFAPGSGSGSGAASITMAAQAGAASVGLGAGPAGGGASLNGYDSGKGADGITGVVRIRWIYNA